VAQAGEGGGNTSRERAKLRFIRSVIHGELAAVVIILLCAAMMARGGWI
jgi:putative membrane protein